MQPLEDSAHCQRARRAASRSAGPEPRLQREELPGEVLVQDVQDALQTWTASYAVRRTSRLLQQKHRGGKSEK